MALPILGLRVRLKGAAAEKYTLSYEATFVDGSTAAAGMAGEACEAPSLSPLEAFRIDIVDNAAARGAKPAGVRPPPAKIPAAKAPPVRRPR
jgi:hypothetical protein